MNRVLATVCILAAHVVHAGAPEFDRLKAISGEWKSVASSGKPLVVSYKPMSAGTVLVETYGLGTGHETLTVFHPDVDTVLATHYCAQGNQPRLRLDNASPRHWVFGFADATNLPDAKASHLVRLELELSADGSHLTRTETYQEKGQTEATRLDLVRSH